MSVSVDQPVVPSVELCCVPPVLAGTIWPDVAEWISLAMSRGRMGCFTDVEADVLHGNAYLWLAIEDRTVLAAAVTKVTSDENERLCTLVACAGHDWRRFGSLIDGLEDYARAEDCRAMEICGRPGWSRRLKDYRLVKAVIRKNL